MVPNPDDELEIFVCQDGHGGMGVNFFSTEFLGFRTICSSDYSVYDGRCTYTHMLHAHFSAHGACRVTFAHLNACHTRAWVKCL